MRILICVFGVLIGALEISAEEINGVNLILDEGFGARYPGLANAFLGLEGDGSAQAVHPAAMNDVSQLFIMATHMQKFGFFDYDHFSAVIPFHEEATLGFGFSRFAATSEERSASDVDRVLGQLEAADYQLLGAFSRRWNNLDLGANLNIVYRKLDQRGLGMRSDFSAQYRLFEYFRLGTLLKGALPSWARWESEKVEYEPPDLFLGAGAEIPSAYFYGVFRFSYQTEGLFQKRAKSQTEAAGERLFESPGDVLATGNFGIEYALNMGLKFRFGFPEMMGSPSNLRPSMGLGYLYRNWIGIDYSFNTHLELSGTHRVSLFVSPLIMGEKMVRPVARKPLVQQPEQIGETPGLVEEEVMGDEENPAVKETEVLEEEPVELPDEAEEIIEEDEIEELEEE